MFVTKMKQYMQFSWKLSECGIVITGTCANKRAREEAGLLSFYSHSLFDLVHSSLVCLVQLFIL